MKKIFEKLIKLQPVTLMIRHAERFPIRSVDSAWDVLLTEKGKEDAYHYGTEAAALSPLTIYHSPIQRCRQTAENIAKGIDDSGGRAGPLGVLDDLGGPYAVTGFKTLQDMIVQHGIQDFLRMWFDGKLPDGHLLPLEEAAKIGYSCIQRVSSTHNNSVILVSHDWNIMILREHLMNMRHEDVGFPGFLDGITYYRSEENEMMLAHHVDLNHEVVL